MQVEESPAHCAVAFQATGKLYSLARRNRRGEGDHGLRRWFPGRSRARREGRRINGHRLRLCDCSNEFLYAFASPRLVGRGSADCLIPRGRTPDLSKVSLEHRPTDRVTVGGEDTPDGRNEREPNLRHLDGRILALQQLDI